ncbi:MAG: HAMP domain-containing protein [Actinobacteria bacterium]|nr:HAMP domain-containing protein [Actinomycetota bacterium]
MKTLRGRAFAYLAIAIVAGIVVTVATGILLTRNNVEQRTLEDLEHQADIVEVVLETSRKKALEALETRLAAREIFLTSPGESATEEVTERSGRARIEGREVLFVRRETDDGPFLLSRPTSFGSDQLSSFVLGLVAAGAGGGALALIVAAIVARGIGKPVREVSDAAAALASERTPRRRSTNQYELEDLRVSFNRMAARLRDARAAEQAFLTSASKELKAPLDVIRRHVDSIEDGTADKYDAAKGIDEEAAHLDRLVRDLMDLAQLGTDRFELQRKPVDLVEIAQTAATRHRADAAAREIEIDIEAAGHNWVLADHDRLAQVAGNLVENALRASGEGSKITIATEPGVFRVLDEGPGLTEDDLERAFDRFYLYERSGAGTRDGSGLGMAIVKEMTEAMGGAATAHVRVGEGATFAVRLPKYPEER